MQARYKFMILCNGEGRRKKKLAKADFIVPCFPLMSLVPFPSQSTVLSILYFFFLESSCLMGLLLFLSQLSSSFIYLLSLVKHFLPLQPLSSLFLQLGQNRRCRLLTFFYLSIFRLSSNQSSHSSTEFFLPIKRFRNTGRRCYFFLQCSVIILFLFVICTHFITLNVGNYSKNIKI